MFIKKTVKAYFRVPALMHVLRCNLLRLLCEFFLQITLEFFLVRSELGDMISNALDELFAKAVIILVDALLLELLVHLHEARFKHRVVRRLVGRRRFRLLGTRLRLQALDDGGKACGAAIHNLRGDRVKAGKDDSVTRYLCLKLGNALPTLCALLVDVALLPAHE